MTQAPVEPPAREPPARDAPQRPPSAVLLLGTPGLRGEDVLRFQPIACSVEGTLEVGLRCADLLPENARVRVGDGVMTLARSKEGFVDEAGEHTYQAPRGPACCMYNTCVGETVSFHAPAGTPAREKVLAVWPDGADIGLRIARADDRADDAQAPWRTNPKLEHVQSVLAGNRRVASVRDAGCRSCGALWVDEEGWHSLRLGPGVDAYEVLGTTDLDGDGHFEVTVYERWRNDYGLLFLGNGWEKPAYRFSCGNI